jgi:exopolyphosphatase/guanosine-5'-triphosphate,3'-diphosphate pyrophosphatase
MTGESTDNTVTPFPIPAGAKFGRVGVIDIGSNTIRLVVYDTPTRLPIPIFNEKANCALVSGLEQSGRLSPEGITKAIRSLTRFVRLSEQMGVERLELVATAAVREASDGLEFVSRVEELLGVVVQVASGAEEARLAALGLLSGVPNADGLLVDLGGGSVDLVELNGGEFGANATMPLGHLRLAEAAKGEAGRALRLVEEEVAGLEWLAGCRGRTLYAVGGICRALARVLIEQVGYPLHVVDGYTMERRDALRLTRLISNMGSGSLFNISGVSKRRVKSLPYCAMVLGVLMEATEPKHLTFSGFGMREGQLIKVLPESLRDQDPLLAGCAGMAERTGRFSIEGQEMFDWMAPLFPPDRDAHSRLRMAACMLSDIGWSEHPDYRAEHAFLRVLRLPFAGLAHVERVFLALAIFVSYNGHPDNAVVPPVRALLDEDELARANVVGLALRLAHTVSGSAPGLLPQTRFERNGDEIVLKLPNDPRESDVFSSEAVEHRLGTLAKALGGKGRLD